MKSISSNYFEGILQLRNANDDILNFAIRSIEKKENTNIANIKKVTNGFDIYMAPQTFLRSLGNSLQKKFGGQLVISKRLHTQNKLTSKQVYRVNALFRMPNFRIGDIIKYRGDKVKVMSIKEKVSIKDIRTGRTKNVDFKQMINIH